MLEGGCFCGKTRYRVDGEPLWQAQCHCRDCQRASGADYVSWIGVKAAETTWTGPRREYRSSADAIRSFCTECGTPLSFAAERWPEELHLYAPTLDDLSLYHPTAHVHWVEHVPWLAIRDDLRKFSGVGGTPLVEDTPSDQ